MRIFDCHSHWATEGRSVMRTDEDWRHAERIWKMERRTYGDEEQADYFRKHGARAILDLSYTKTLPIEEMRQHHNYALAYQRRFPDVVFGHWLQFEPWRSTESLAEFQRCRDAKAGFVGFCVNGQVTGVPPSDPLWDPFYKRSIDLNAPVMILCGLTGIGQGHKGGKGIILDHGHPRHIDAVAARFPDLNVLAARPAYPWQDEMIAVLLHKGNVHYELHGWGPQHFTPALKKEIRGRLQDRIMFGCDFPGLMFERVIPAWQSEGYAQEVLDKVLYRNAEVYFPALTAASTNAANAETTREQLGIG
jgi:predicted TIM-barrel fold metal-dependent hydrolase